MSGLPYKFEPGMRVCVAEDCAGIISGVEVATGSGVTMYRVLEPDGSWGWWGPHRLTADLDHPGTRGLLLQQYRDASGHAEATPVFLGDAYGGWIVDHDPTGDGPEGGNGESEGAAILDALTRLAADRARESEQAKSVEGSEAIASAMLVEVAQRLRAVERRMSELERKVGQ
jgi:hypothetical protein